MDISYSIDLIEDALTEYFDSRMYAFYLQCIDKEKCNTFTEYKKLAGVYKGNKEKEINIEKRKKDAETTLKKIVKG